MLDYIHFLKVNPRYTTHGVFAANSAYDQARAMKRAGYATDPEYADKLMEIIDGRDLTQFDAAPMYA